MTEARAVQTVRAAQRACEAVLPPLCPAGHLSHKGREKPPGTPARCRRAGRPDLCISRQPARRQESTVQHDAGLWIPAFAGSNGGIQV